MPQARLDEMVRRILTGVIANGLMDEPVPSKPVPIDYAAHADIAQRAAEAGIVLLKNDGALLPLARTTRRILVVGAHADALLAIRVAASGARVDYVDGTDVRAAAAAARGADIVVLFAWHWQTEAMDAGSLSLPANQDALIEAVAAANPRTAVVLETGGPVTMPWLAKVPAVLEAWYPGQRGGPAIARVLFGEIAPSGHLPMTFPRGVIQTPRPAIVGADALKAADARRLAGSKTDGGPGAVPPFAVDYREGANVGYRWYEATRRKPLFPFGYGLSYTAFRYSDLTVADGPTPVIGFAITNTGSRAGADVPQIYVRAPGTSADATYHLAGWRKLMLAPNETRQVDFALDPRVVAHFDVAAHRWRLDAGRYSIAVGRSTNDRALAATADLTARTFSP